MPASDHEGEPGTATSEKGKGWFTLLPAGESAYEKVEHVDGERQRSGVVPRMTPPMVVPMSECSGTEKA